MTATPAISVVLPVYNAARYLKGALASIQTQTITDFEVIAVDDGSQDGSKAILDNFAARDPRIRVLSRPNSGLVVDFNDVLRDARGRFIGRIDSDDSALPTRVAALLDYLVAHSECVALGTDILYTDPESAPLIRLHPPTKHARIIEPLLAGNG